MYPIVSLDPHHKEQFYSNQLSVSSNQLKLINTLKVFVSYVLVICYNTGKVGFIHLYEIIYELTVPRPPIKFFLMRQGLTDLTRCDEHMVKELFLPRTYQV